MIATLLMMIRAGTGLAFLALLLFQPAASADDLGPAVGRVAPAIGAPSDQAGKARSLDDLMGQKGLVLLFFRSAAWCPYCQAQLIDVQTGYDAIENRGYHIAALSYDAPEVQAKFKAERGIAYTFLSDPKSEVIDRWGLRDPQYKPGSVAYGVPRPIIFVLDRSGVIKAKLFEETFKTRPPTTAVIAKLDEIAASP
jgi:peroxiredoxin